MTKAVTEAARPAPLPLPFTTAELLSFRKTPSRVSLNDLVEQLHLKLWEDDKYQGFLFAIYNEQAVEGSLVADQLEAARMIRALAADLADDNSLYVLVRSEKLATLAKILRVVMRRYGLSRAERRATVAGVAVADEPPLPLSDDPSED